MEIPIERRPLGQLTEEEIRDWLMKHGVETREKNKADGPDKAAEIGKMSLLGGFAYSGRNRRTEYLFKNGAMNSEKAINSAVKAAMQADRQLKPEEGADFWKNFWSNFMSSKMDHASIMDRASGILGLLKKGGVPRPDFNKVVHFAILLNTLEVNFKKCHKGRFEVRACALDASKKARLGEAYTGKAGIIHVTAGFDRAKRATDATGYTVSEINDIIRLRCAAIADSIGLAFHMRMNFSSDALRILFPGKNRKEPEKKPKPAKKPRTRNT